MLPREILKLRSSDIAANVYYASYFGILQGGQPSFIKGALIPILYKMGGACSLYPPVPTSMFATFAYICLFKVCRLSYMPKNSKNH